MYDFYFGTPAEIEADEEGFLLGVKRLLPRWVNSIPDSEYLALHQLFEKHCRKQRPVLVETGVGASTIALLHSAMKYDGVLYSWDIANPKGAELRNICTDTLEQHHRKSIWDHWRFVAYSSLSEYLGIPILRELDEQVDFCFLDSEHTWCTLRGELEYLKDVLAPNAIVTIDDANYDYDHVNIAYVNMFRKKLDLAPVDGQANNSCRGFGVETEALLQEHFDTVNHLDHGYSDSWETDLFYAWYNNSRKPMLEDGMEKQDKLAERFRAWKIG
ncbi:MAG TPA: hypothetical protein DIT01_04235 [Lentisphaeria bacterium]|nr:hypothetical protein [Lentisphaeria bacterium]|tara:strand:- start:4841 stop:5656 length:816 start_codon:yes stop_codon:yes gene_type:complete